MNYFELYPGDYLRDTGELSLMQHGAYLLLMATCYSTENGLPSDNTGLFRITRALAPEEQEATLYVARKFFDLCNDGRLRSERIDADIAKAKARIDAARTNGAKGGRPPKPKPNPDETGGKPAGFPTGSDPVEQNETQKKAHQTPPTTSTSEIDTHERATLAGEAALAMRRAGCVSINQSNPVFLAALDEGVTPKEFADAVEAHKARIPGSGLFVYAVKAARSNHAEQVPTLTPLTPLARAGPPAQVGGGKVMGLLHTLEGMKNGMDKPGVSDGLPDAGYARIGGAAGR